MRGIGRSAAAMGSVDAARLILAAIGSAQARDTVDSVVAFGGLKAWPDPPPEEPRDLGSPRAFPGPTLETTLARELYRLRWPAFLDDPSYIYRDVWLAEGEAEQLGVPALQLDGLRQVRPAESGGAAAVLARPHGAMQFFRFPGRGSRRAAVLSGGRAPGPHPDAIREPAGPGADREATVSVAVRALGAGFGRAPPPRGGAGPRGGRGEPLHGPGAPAPRGLALRRGMGEPAPPRRRRLRRSPPRCVAENA